MLKPGIEWNKDADTLYFQISDNPISHSFEITRDVIVDLDAGNAVVGIDIQNVTEVISEYAKRLAPAPANKNARLQFVAT